jgi:hypothetical protein
LQGTQGLQGLQGRQGIQGLQGTQGLQGLQGRQGIQGLQGGYDHLTTTITGVSGIGLYYDDPADELSLYFNSSSLDATFPISATDYILIEKDGVPYRSTIGGSAYQILYKDSNGNVTGNYNLTVSGNVINSDIQIHDLSVYNNVLHGHETDGLVLYANEYYSDVGISGPLQSTANIDLFGESVNVFNNISVSGRIFIKQTGTASQPAISFINDENTGLYHPLPDWLVFSTSGTPRFSVSQEGLVINHNNVLILPSGNVSSPSIVFYHGGAVVDKDTGIFSNEPNTVSVSTQSVERIKVGTSGDFSSVVEGGSTLYPMYVSRAWVNFDGSTNTIRSAGNITSITDHGAGDYTVNLANSMPDTNYVVSLSSEASNNRIKDDVSSRTSSSFRIGTFNNSFTAVDSNYVGVSVFR